MPAHQGKFVAYFRVSTDRQGKSGLGLEAQWKSVLTISDGGRWELVAEFTEVESGSTMTGQNWKRLLPPARSKEQGSSSPSSIACPETSRSSRP